MPNFEFRVLTSLDKVFYDEAPEKAESRFQGFSNEKISFQVAFRMDEAQWWDVYAEVESPLKEYVRIRHVKQVPVALATFGDEAEDLLRTAPGLYPDCLEDITPHCLHVSKRWSSIWVDVETDGQVAPGDYPLILHFRGWEEQELGTAETVITVLPGKLPAQTLKHTKWFHCDGLARYYKVDVFSEEHWQIIENYVQAAVKGGINMILMPVHTPPLDTRVNGERMTTQLVDIAVENGQYVFNMDKVRRWIRMCKKCGVEYYEIAHLFTQWGAQHAPKIMARVNGEEKRIFGWDTDAAGEEYGAFLKAYIPAIREVLREEGVEDKTCWHISDEPSRDHLEYYLKARRQVEKVLEGCVIMDALSDFDFYAQGVVPCPVVANDHIEPFIEAKVPGLWTYYCCAQYRKVSNCFIAMPSYRTRILAVQLFKYDIDGFLQWGYNFYNSQYSDYPINPFMTTDADGWVPAGDPFQVYPGEDGKPLESIRMAVMHQAMQDLRAMNWLKDLAGKEFVVNLIDGELENPVTFSEYPRNKEYQLKLRKKVNAEIVKRL